MYKQNKQAMANFVYNSVVAVFIFQTEWVWLFDVPNSALFLVKRSALSKQSKVHQGKLFSIIIKEETAWRKIHWKHNCWHSTTLSIWWISCPFKSWKSGYTKEFKGKVYQKSLWSVSSGKWLACVCNAILLCTPLAMWWTGMMEWKSFLLVISQSSWVLSTISHL